MFCLFYLTAKLNYGKLLHHTSLWFVHICSTSVTKTAFYQLKNISKVRPFLSLSNTERLMHAFITSRLDYCNALLSGLPKSTINQLQLMQNSAARVLTRTRRRAHITPILKSLHCLLVFVLILKFFY